MKPIDQASGSFATFFLLKRSGMTSGEARKCVRGWAREVRSMYAPNPLSLSTRKHLTAFYDRPGNTGD